MGDLSAIASFAISAALIPELTSPVNTQVETLMPVFGWSEVNGASAYLIMVSSAEDFSEITFQATVEGTGTTYPISGAALLDYEQTYYWRVQAQDADGNTLGDFSATAFFITPTSEIEITIDYGP